MHCSNCSSSSSSTDSPGVSSPRQPPAVLVRETGAAVLSVAPLLHTGAALYQATRLFLPTAVDLGLSPAAQSQDVLFLVELPGAPFNPEGATTVFAVSPIEFREGAR